MKVLQINSVCGYGSTGSIAVDISKMVETSVDSCMIAYGRGNAPDNVNSVRIGTNFDVKWHGVYTRITDRHGFASKRATMDFIQKAELYSPDLIHLHNIHGYYINIRLLFEWLKKYGRPVIWTLHDCWAYTGHCAHYSAAGCDLWKSGCHNCPQKRAYPASYFWDSSSMNFQDKKDLFTSLPKLYLVTPSKWLKREVKQSFLSKYPVTTILNGIDLDAFKPTQGLLGEKYGFKNKKIILGVANEWSANKGLSDFIKLSEDLDDSFQIVLAGLNSKQIKALPARILGIERTSSVQELAELYSTADVFVNPSREETMGLVTVEAMACGAPAIVYPFTAVPEAVDANSGLVTSGYSEMLEAVKSRSFQNFRPEDCILRAHRFERDSQYTLYNKLYREVLK